MGNLDNFLAQLNNQAALSSGQKVVSKKQWEKIYCAHPDNQGGYQVVPFNNPVTGYPYVTMYDTKEVNIKAEFTKDNTKTVVDVWHKILPKDAYIMRDNTNRIVSSLTKDEENLWETANKLWRELYGELGGYKKSTEKTPEDVKTIGSLLRTKNYTLFNAYCMARLGDNNRNTKREKFCATFVIPAKGFMDTVKQNVDQLTQLDYNGDNSWMNNIYSDNTTTRNGYVLFTITRPQTVYVVTVTHKITPNPVTMEISDEDLAYLSKSPTENFLGKAANEELETVTPEHRHLFNSTEYQKMIDYMVNMLAAIRTSKANGMDTASAIATTTATALANSNANKSTVQGFVDPCLAQTQPTNTVNAEKVVVNNTTPFQNPPAAHIDPVTGAPVQTTNTGAFGNFNAAGFGATPTQQAAPFSSPFGSTAATGKTDDLPF